MEKKKKDLRIKNEYLCVRVVPTLNTSVKVSTLLATAPRDDYFHFGVFFLFHSILYI